MTPHPTLSSPQRHQQCSLSGMGLRSLPSLCSPAQQEEVQGRHADPWSWLLCHAHIRSALQRSPCVIRSCVWPSSNCCWVKLEKPPEPRALPAASEEVTRSCHEDVQDGGRETREPGLGCSRLANESWEVRDWSEQRALLPLCREGEKLLWNAFSKLALIHSILYTPLLIGAWHQQKPIGVSSTYWFML